MSIQHDGPPSFSGARATVWRSQFICGVMGANVSLKLTDIKDGTSDTILVGEIRAGVTSFDCRGVWAMSGGCPSALWAHGYHGDDNGPNSASIWADDLQSCTDVYTATGDSSGVRLAKMGMACSNGNWPNWQQTVRSMHSGGGYCCFADGSVRWISDFVQTGTDQANLGVWDRLNLSSDGQTVSGKNY